MTLTITADSVAISLFFFRLWILPYSDVPFSFAFILYITQPQLFRAQHTTTSYKEGND